MDWIAGLDRWTGLLDWITGLTFELKHVTSTQSDVLNWITCSANTDYRETKDVACSYCGSFVPKGMRVLQQMEQLGRPIGTIIYSKASC